MKLNELQNKMKPFSLIILLFLIGWVSCKIKGEPFRRPAEVIEEKEPTNDIYKLERTEYKEDLLSDYTGYVLIGRSTCEYCAIVYDYMSSLTFDSPCMYISLEELYAGSEYDLTKRELGITEVPIIRYYNEGKVEREMECPLDTRYPDTTDYGYRKILYMDMKDRIARFLNGENIDAKNEIILKRKDYLNISTSSELSREKEK